jgi:hypothetical protein
MYSSSWLSFSIPNSISSEVKVMMAMRKPMRLLLSLLLDKLFRWENPLMSRQTWLIHPVLTMLRDRAGVDSSLRREGAHPRMVSLVAQRLWLLIFLTN